MTRYPWFRLLLTPAICLTGLASHAGEGGCVPEDGTYTFHKTDPPPAEDVATGKCSGSSMDLTVPGAPKEEWSQEEDGQYRKVGGTGHRSICFHDGDPITYEYKLDGDVLSSGELQP